MKRRLDESSERESKQPAAAMGDDMKQMVAAMIAKELMQNLSAVNGTKVRFGNVGFQSTEQQNVNAFLHQKLGKSHLTRRPGPGGTRLTYIESCKAIELANQAFGFNGWSCRIIECKEEYRTQKGDRWSIGFSSLVRIELKDGTSHEDFGFGQADGQRDLGAAIEQAKKASISDARKRALRLFGEYLGNSCYDREHIKDVHSNRVPMATNAASPAEMAGRATAAMAVSASGMPTVLTAAASTINAPQRAPTPMQPQNAPAPMQPRPQPVQTPPQAAYNSSNTSAPPRHNNGPPAASSSFASTNTSNGAVGQPGISTNGVASRTSAIQAVDMNKRQAIAAAHGGPAAAPVGQQQQQQQQQQHHQQQQRAFQPNPAPLQNQPPPTSTSASPYGQGQYPRQPLHTVGTNAPPPTRIANTNAPPPTRMAGYQPQQSSPLIKSETARPQAPTEYDMNDLSLSQFDYEPQR